MQLSMNLAVNELYFSRYCRDVGSQNGRKAWEYIQERTGKNFVPKSAGVLDIKC